MEIRIATLEDAQGIALLEKETFTVPWSYEAVYKDLENPVATYIVAEDNQRIIGYVGVWCVVDEGQITNVAVHKEYRRQGVAKKVIYTLVEFAKDKNLYSLLLEVRESNDAAKRLYEGCGFKFIGKRKNYYTKPVEDACMMILEV